MRDLQRRLTGRRQDDSGMTLVEMLISMIVFSIAMTMVYSAVILVVKKSNDVQKTADAVSELRLALEQIDRQIRSGNVLYSPANEPTYVASCTSTAANAGSCMRIFTQSNGDERCVQWQVLADPAHPGTSVLRTRSWSATWQTGGAMKDWGVVARGLKVASGTSPFVLEGASTPYNQRLLDVRFEAWDSRRAKTVSITSSLAGRNTDYGYDSGQCTPVPPE